MNSQRMGEDNKENIPPMSSNIGVEHLLSEQRTLVEQVYDDIVNMQTGINLMLSEIEELYPAGMYAMHYPREIVVPPRSFFVHDQMVTQEQRVSNRILIDLEEDMREYFVALMQVKSEIIASMREPNHAIESDAEEKDPNEYPTLMHESTLTEVWNPVLSGSDDDIFGVVPEEDPEQM